MIRLFQHSQTRSYHWENQPPNIWWVEVPWIYEDDLPEGITDEQYSTWYGNSIVNDGVRIGPALMPAGDVREMRRKEK